MTDPFERIIRRTVEGQIRGFLKEHPSIVEAVDWYKPRQDKATTFTNSLAKRIVRDLACPMNRARLEAALLEQLPAPPSTPAVAVRSCGGAGRPGISQPGRPRYLLALSGALAAGTGAMAVGWFLTWYLSDMPTIMIFGG